MSEHFSAPPGWPVEPGWQPSPGWEPDPTWPPAPPDWRFWVDDVPDRFAAGGRPKLPAKPGVRINRGTALAAAALVIALAVGTVAVVLWLNQWSSHRTANSAANVGSSGQYSAPPSSNTPWSPTALSPTPPTVAAITFDGMRSFVMSYYGELPGNIPGAWQKLDPYYASEHGYQDYVNFWSGIRSVSVLSVSPRDNTSVTAQLEYLRTDGSTTTENRWLSFVATGSTLLIYDSDVVA